MSKEIAIVTGGASGIGLAISKELMNKDIQVVAADINEDALNEAKKKRTNCLMVNGLMLQMKAM